jgi:hypothetical protein
VRGHDHERAVDRAELDREPLDLLGLERNDLVPAGSVAVQAAISATRRSSSSRLRSPKTLTA